MELESKYLILLHIIKSNTVSATWKNSDFGFCAQSVRGTALRKAQCGTEQCGVLLQVVSLYRKKQQDLWSCDTLLIYLYEWLVIIDGSHTTSLAKILITSSASLLTLVLLIHGFHLCSRFLCVCVTLALTSVPLSKMITYDFIVIRCVLSFNIMSVAFLSLLILVSVTAIHSQ